MGDVVFPLRDFLEILMFSYLFFYQSKKQKSLQKINERYLKLMKEDAVRETVKQAPL